jgi:putative hydrolase of the HAD superfamily
MLAITRLAPEVFESHYWRHRPAYDRGTFHGVGYWREFAQSAAISLTDQQVAELIKQDVTVWTATDPLMVDWVRRLHKAGVLTAILSNMCGEIRDHMVENFDWLGDFRHLTWSCELGISKPDSAIYSHTLEKLGVSADEALFIDDLKENVRAAEAIGLHAILFTTPAQLQTDLELNGFATQLPPVTSGR